MTGQFDEAKVRRERDGKFGSQKRGVVYLDDDQLAPPVPGDARVFDLLGEHHLLVVDPCEVAGGLEWLPANVDHLTARHDLRPGLVIGGVVDLQCELLSSANSTFGHGHDDEEDDELAIAWLNEHNDDLDRVLAEDHGAHLDVAFDTWDSQQLVLERRVSSVADLNTAAGALDDDRAERLFDMVNKGDYAPLFAEAEKHARDRQRVRDLGARAIDAITDTLGNETAERARYLTYATKWSDDGGRFHEVTTYDTQGAVLGTFITDINLERNRVPSDMMVAAEDPVEPLLLNRAQNHTSMVDLDRAGANVWGRAKP